MQELPSTTRKRRRGLALGLTVVVLVAVVTVGYFWQTGPEARKAGPAKPPVLDAGPITIMPGIHLLGGLSPAAAYAVETSAGLVLVDAGLDPEAGPLKQELKALGLDGRQVKAVLLTHVHGDHTGGAAHFQTIAGAKVYAGRGDEAILRAGQPRVAYFSTYHMPYAKIRPLFADVVLDGDEVITFGDVRFRVLAAPGHTPGSICYLMERDGLRALFSGDVIICLRGGNPDFRKRTVQPLGTATAYLSPRYRGDAHTFLATLQKLRALPVPDLVLPGHPRMDSPPESPSLSQERWQALLDEGIGEMTTLIKHFEEDGANFLDGTPRKLLPDLFYLGDLKGASVYGFFASSRFYLVDAPGGPGLLDFVNARLGKLGLKPVMPAAVLLTSCDSETTGGLEELIEKTHAAVVAGAEAIGTVQQRCPAGTVVLSAESLPAKGWFDVRPIVLRGRGLAPVAYEIKRENKTVLFSGRIPIVRSNHEAVTALFADLRLKNDSSGYRAALTELGKLRPDMWLPAFPAEDQNANLYDREWEDILESNRRMFR